MGYLIASLEDAIFHLPIELLSKRHKLQDPTIDEVRTLIESTGKYELGDILATNPASEWPITALVYTSQDKRGFGRTGSKLYAYPVRRMTVSPKG